MNGNVIILKESATFEVRNTRIKTLGIKTLSLEFIGGAPS